MPPSLPAWDQLDGESDCAYQKFRLYLQLGLGRSLRRAYAAWRAGGQDAAPKGAKRRQRAGGQDAAAPRSAPQQELGETGQPEALKSRETPPDPTAATGPTPSLTPHPPVPPGQWTRLSKRWRWKERAAAHDAAHHWRPLIERLEAETAARLEKERAARLEKERAEQRERQRAFKAAWRERRRAGGNRRREKAPKGSRRARVPKGRPSPPVDILAHLLGGSTGRIRRGNTSEGMD